MPHRLLSVLSPRKPRFDPGLVLVRLLIDILVLGQVLKKAVLISPSTIIIQILRSRFCLHAALCLKDKRTNPVNFQKAMIFLKSGNCVWKGIFT